MSPNQQKKLHSFNHYALQLACAAVFVTANISHTSFASELVKPVSIETVAEDEKMELAQIAKQLQIGDLVFIRVSALPFQKVAAATQSWTNHVGVVVQSADDPERVMIAESTFPFSKQDDLRKFLQRSEQGRIAITRLQQPLNEEQKHKLILAAKQRTGIFYDTGFDLHSKRQFCSRFVREVIKDASGLELGEVENFQQLLHKQPNLELGFWRMWFFGLIPWDRETVSPLVLCRAIRP